MPALLRDVQSRSNEGRIPSNGYHTSPKFVNDSLGVVRRAYTKNALHSITSQQNNSNHQASDLVIRAIMPPDCEQYSSPSLYRLRLCSYVRGGCEFVGRFSRRLRCCSTCLDQYTVLPRRTSQSCPLCERFKPLHSGGIEMAGVPPPERVAPA